LEEFDEVTLVRDEVDHKPLTEENKSFEIKMQQKEKSKNKESKESKDKTPRAAKVKVPAEKTPEIQEFELQFKSSFFQWAQQSKPTTTKKSQTTKEKKNTRKTKKVSEEKPVETTSSPFLIQKKEGRLFCPFPSCEKSFLNNHGIAYHFKHYEHSVLEMLQVFQSKFYTIYCNLFFIFFKNC
jgi:hypothetical protein